MRLKLLLGSLAAAILMAWSPVEASASEATPAEAPAKVRYSRTRPPKKGKSNAAPAKTKANAEPNAKSAESKAAAKPKAAGKKNANAPRKQGAAKKGAAKKGAKAGESRVAAPSANYRAFKVNVPYAAAVIQNLAFEWQTGRKMTVDIPVMWSFSDLTDRHGLRTIAIQPEARWWPGANPGYGHFLGAHLNLAWFNARWNDYRYQADSMPLMGAGISYGYRLNFTPNWGMEFNIGAGYAYMEYDRFYNIENGAKIDRRSYHYFGITRVGLSLVYRF